MLRAQVCTAWEQDMPAAGVGGILALVPEAVVLLLLLLLPPMVGIDGCSSAYCFGSTLQWTSTA
jgi:hypothetical protein